MIGIQLLVLYSNRKENSVNFLGVYELLLNIDIGRYRYNFEIIVHPYKIYTVLILHTNWNTVYLPNIVDFIPILDINDISNRYMLMYL